MLADYDLSLWLRAWPWPSSFKVRIRNSLISGMGWPINIERKVCESSIYDHAILTCVTMVGWVYVPDSDCRYIIGLEGRWNRFSIIGTTSEWTTLRWKGCFLIIFVTDSMSLCMGATFRKSLSCQSYCFQCDVKNVLFALVNCLPK